MTFLETETTVSGITLHVLLRRFLRKQHSGITVAKADPSQLSSRQELVPSAISKQAPGCLHLPSGNTDSQASARWLATRKPRAAFPLQINCRIYCVSTAGFFLGIVVHWGTSFYHASRHMPREVFAIFAGSENSRFFLSWPFRLCPAMSRCALTRPHLLMVSPSGLFLFL